MYARFAPTAHQHYKRGKKQQQSNPEKALAKLSPTDFDTSARLLSYQINKPLKISGGTIGVFRALSLLLAQEFRQNKCLTSALNNWGRPSTPLKLA